LTGVREAKRQRTTKRVHELCSRGKRRNKSRSCSQARGGDCVGLSGRGEKKAMYMVLARSGTAKKAGTHLSAWQNKRRISLWLSVKGKRHGLRRAKKKKGVGSFYKGDNSFLSRYRKESKRFHVAHRKTKKVLQQCRITIRKKGS